MSIIIGNIYTGGLTTMGFTTADNGLNASSATNVELGGPLTKNTTITPAAFTLLLGQLGITATETTSSATPVNPTDLVRLADITYRRIAKDTAGGITASTVLIAPVGALANMIRVSGALDITGITAGTAQLFLQYIDAGGTTRTVPLTVSATALGQTASNPVLIYSNTITSATVFITITGTLTCGASCSIEELL